MKLTQYQHGNNGNTVRLGAILSEETKNKIRNRMKEHYRLFPNVKMTDAERRSKRREYYQKNKGLLREIEIRWKENHPEDYKEMRRRERVKNKERINHANRMYYLRKSGAEGSFTIGEWELLKKQYGFTCPLCKRTEPNIKLTKDHIIPLSKGGSNFIENIQPLCLGCNARKRDKVAII